MKNGFIDSIIEELNSEQKDAVECTEGPILIIAGAGTGKTKVITTKIAYLIAKEYAKPEEILALTFTEKAAEEMQTRIDQILPYGLNNIDINTFHSFGDLILKENALEIGLTPEYKLMNTAEEIYFFKENLFKFDLQYYRPLSNPTKFIDAILTLFSRLKDEDVSPHEYHNFIKDLESDEKKGKSRNFDSVKTLGEYINIQKELYKTYEKYELLKKENGVIGFSDLIGTSLNLLKEKSVVRNYYQNKYKYVLVDEYQDTNYAQNEIVKIISDKTKNICVCGDDDQSIYKFRGASISNILEFQDNYPDHKKFVLVKNYRSSQSILDSAYKLIQNNNPDRLEIKANINKRLIGVNDNKENSVFGMEFKNLKEELEYTSNEIIRLKQENSLEYSDFAVLVRTNSQVQPLIRVLEANKIPYKYQGNSGLYETKEIRLLLSFLYSICRLDDNVSLFNLASSSLYNISMNTLTLSNNFAKQNSKYLSYIFENIENNIEDLILNESEINKIKLLINDLEKYREMSRDINVGSILYEYLSEKKFFDNLIDKNLLTELENTQKLFQRIDRFISNSNQTSVIQFCEYIDYTREIGDEPISSEIEIDKQAVNILTIHRAKGMEFNTVFMIDLINGKFPTRIQRDPIEIPIELIKETLPSGNFHIEEERRLFYVGLTRAKERLFLFWAKDYYQKTLKKISPFVKETIDSFESPDTKNFIQLTNENSTTIESTKIETKDIDNKRSSKLNAISLTKIEDYLTCPLKYKYIHIMKVITPPSVNLFYGSLIHSLIEQILKRELNGNSITLEETLSMLESLWRDKGFLSKEHLEQTHQKAINDISSFYKIKKTFNPKFIEKPFKIKFYNNFILQGRWDLITKDDSIIDFKTSSVTTSKDALRKAKDSLQLKVYSMAFENEYKKLPSKVSLFFTGSNITDGYIPNEKSILTAEKTIQTVINGIENNQFEANPSYMACTYCPLNKICPFTAVN